MHHLPLSSNTAWLKFRASASLTTHIVIMLNSLYDTLYTSPYTTYTPPRWPLTRFGKQGNRKSISKSGPCPVAQFGDLPVLNSGILFGTPVGMAKLLYVFAVLDCSMEHKNPDASGQGLLNFMFYYGLLNSVRTKVLPLAVSFFVHMESYIPELRHPSLPFDICKNPFVNIMNISYSIIHQVNRPHISDIMNKWLTGLSNFTNKDKVFMC